MAPVVYVPGYLIKEECINSYQEEVMKWTVTCPCNASCKCEYYPMSPEEKLCLDNRKYWTFLLSSLATFCVCLLLVMVWRVLVFCYEECCGRGGAAAAPPLIAGADAWSDADDRSTAAPPIILPSIIVDNASTTSSIDNLRPASVAGSSAGSSMDLRQRRKSQQQQTRQRRLTSATVLTAADTLAEQSGQIGWMTEAKDYAGELISGQTHSGRVLVVLSFMMTMASLILYFYDASHSSFQVETCVPWTQSVVQQIDLGLNLFFLAYFFIRFIAASDKVLFLIEVGNYVDYFIIPPSFVSVYLGRTWLGLRFLRALRLMTVPDILQYLNVLRTSGSIRLAQLLSIFISVSLAAAGVIHLLENSGDPWRNFENPRRITYWECVYFLVVTMGTVGYGDIVCTTSLARLFMIFFILGGLAMFASYIPEIVDIVGSRPKYRNFYEPERGKKHVLVCGFVTFDSVSHLINDFMLDNKSTSDIQLVFLHRKLPDLELEGLLKRHFTRMEFIHGSVMEPSDLSKVKAEQADACLVMANKHATDPDAEDAANIMRVVSIKNYSSDTRVIVQLIQYHSKTYLLNIPTWNWRQGDDVVCLGELKLGILAQSCLSPGVSTMLANLFTMRPAKEGSRIQPWQPNYIRGSRMNVFMETLSHAFVGMSFPAAADFIFSRLRVLLIAIEIKDEDQRECNIVINPSNDVIITTHTQGFFVARSADEVKRVFYFCKTCHAGIHQITMIKKCKCKEISLFRQGARPLSIMIKPIRRRLQSTSAETNLNLNFLSGVTSTLSMMRLPTSYLEANFTKFISDRLLSSDVNSFRVNHGTNMKREAYSDLRAGIDNGIDLGEEEFRFDTTGMFHWCPAAQIDDVVLDHNQFALLSLNNHVVVCLFADTTSPLLGLANFVMPLRSSNLHYHELHHIVIVGNLDYLRREWEVLQNLPKISILSGHPLCRADLRAVNLNRCRTCVILSARTPSPQEDPTLADKEAILASLNVKAMNFEDDDDSIIATIKQLKEKPCEAAKSGGEIRLLTELTNDTNVQFLDQEDEDDPDCGFHTTLPFACGQAFAVSVLDSLMSMTYFNDSTLTLIRALVTGGATLELEMILAEGAGLRGAPTVAETLKKRGRSRIVQESLRHDMFADLPPACTYGHLFRQTLRRYGVLCLGLYRLVDGQIDETFGKRLVITNPSADMVLFSSDYIFSLQPFDFGIKYKRSSMHSSSFGSDNGAFRHDDKD